MFWWDKASCSIQLLFLITLPIHIDSRNIIFLDLSIQYPNQTFQTNKTFVNTKRPPGTELVLRFGAENHVYYYISPRPDVVPSKFLDMMYVAQPDGLPDHAEEQCLYSVWP